MKRLIWVGLYTLLIYLSLPYSRTVQTAFREYLGEQMGLAITLLMIAVACITLFAVIRSIARLQLVVIIAILSSAIGAASLIPIPEERIHILQYGLMGLLIAWALAPLVRGTLGFVLILLLGGLIGFGDELIQWVLPSRVFDWRDVGLNLAGITLGSTLFYLKG